LRTKTKAALYRFDHAFNLRPFAYAQIGDGGNPGLVLVAQRQMKPEILDALQTNFSQRNRQRRTHTNKTADRRHTRVDNRCRRRTNSSRAHAGQA